MKTLFVCKHNRYRSKVAEAIFNRLKSEGDEAKSAGVEIDMMKPYVAESVKNAAREKGYEIINEQTREITFFDLRWADKIVIVADNVDRDIFGDSSKKVEKWDVKDCDEKELDCITRGIEEIEGRVKRFLGI